MVFNGQTMKQSRSVTIVYTAIHYYDVKNVRLCWIKREMNIEKRLRKIHCFNHYLQINFFKNS